MKKKLINILEPLGYEVYEQGSLTENSIYPDDFFTFWNYDTEGHGFYDNSENAVIWHFDISFYSVDPFKPIEVIKEAKKLLKANGWICTGLGIDIPSDTLTHIARTINISFIEREGR